MFKKVKDGKLPTRGSKYSACVDLYAREDVVIGAGETKLVSLGVCLDMDMLTRTLFHNSNGKYPEAWRDRLEKFISKHYLQLMPRSSLALKTGLIMPSVGIIDMDYTGEIGIVLNNPTDARDFNIEEGFKNSQLKIFAGDRIAQITLLEHKSSMFRIDTDVVRNGGFGSSGDI